MSKRDEQIARMKGLMTYGIVSENKKTPVKDSIEGPDGNVYRTPSGTKYHFDPNCGGKNSYKTTLQKAKNAGLTPCAKCAH